VSFLVEFSRLPTKQIILAAPGPGLAAGDGQQRG